MLGAIHGGIIFIEENPGVHPAVLLLSAPADSEMIFDACSNLHCSRVARIPLAVGKHVARVSVLPVSCDTFGTVAGHLAYKYGRKKRNS